ncbi:uncharacterized protein SRS1_16560 [Sporisorium reilianum f. sp. reilianum]|uniref:Uncharacterized protein n=1 Tax=Sporisorium reilianum f. sp. reilianum TaxID=72559 RepID=A0A2N8UCD5_9BASI|nr:uncharacterized protein SRS1_16560 [Sporisorium reilianum f. sp. reilianum]
MTMTRGRFVALALAFAMLFTLFLAKPVMAGDSEDMFEAAKGTLGKEYADQDKTFQANSVNFNKAAFRTFNEYARDDARENGARYLGTVQDFRARDQSSRGFSRYMSFGKQEHYFYSIARPGSQVGNIMGLTNAEDEKNVGMVLWKHRHGDPELHVVRVEKFRDPGINWERHLQPWSDVLAKGAKV